MVNAEEKRAEDTYHERRFFRRDFRRLVFNYSENQLSAKKQERRQLQKDPQKDVKFQNMTAIKLRLSTQETVKKRQGLVMKQSEIKLKNENCLS